MKIAVRVDGSRAIGTGHVRRMISLAKALREMGGDIVFLWRDLGLDNGAEFSAAGFPSLRLAAPSQPFTPALGEPPHARWAEVPASVDAAETVAALANARIERVVVDSYAFDARWHRTVGDALGVPIAVIDDLADRELLADLVVDHNFAPDHRVKYAGRLPAATRLLGGPRFALLDPGYASKPRLALHQDVRSIGVFMGGADPANATARALDAIAATGFAGETEVVATSANAHLPELIARAEASPRLKLSVGLPDLSGFFARHDLQIGAGGGATWERCCIGAPTLGVVVADNQHASLRPLAEAGVLAVCDSLDVEALARALGALIGDSRRRAAFAEASRALVDGPGACRVAAALMQPALTVRAATFEDAERMFDWRNDPAVRAVSRNAEAFGMADHLAWLRKTLASGMRQLFIGEIGGQPVGVIRFDRLADARREVSLYLDPTYLGLGLGPALLRAGEKAVGGAGGFAATVLPENPASSKLFAAAGYHELTPGLWTKGADGGAKEEA